MDYEKYSQFNKIFIIFEGNIFQGHFKIFNPKSLEEFIFKHNFKVQRKFGIPFYFPSPISLINMFFKFIYL